MQVDIGSSFMVSAIVLAAGKGSRMKSDKAKQFTVWSGILGDRHGRISVAVL